MLSFTEYKLIKHTLLKQIEDYRIEEGRLRTHRFKALYNNRENAYNVINDRFKIVQSKINSLLDLHDKFYNNLDSNTKKQVNENTAYGTLEKV